MAQSENPPDRFVAFIRGRNPMRFTLIAPGQWHSESWFPNGWEDECLCCDKVAKAAWEESESYEYNWPEQ